MQKLEIISEESKKILIGMVKPSGIKYVILIGIGASIVNTKALSSFIRLKKEIIYVDTLEQEIIDKLVAGKDSSNSVVVAISKSGSTDETNKILKYLLSQKIINPHCYVVTEHPDSELVKIGFLSNNCKFINYENSKSGRFSILQNAGYVPLLLAGASPEDLFLEFDDPQYEHLAESLIENYERGRKILVISIYNQKFLGFAEWLRQIISESLGKGSFGITPIISIGSIDEHSQLQLYLAGPDDKLYYILPYNNNSTEELSIAQNKHYTAFKQALDKASRPIIPEEYSGFLLIVKWLNIVHYIAEKKGLNPYDQPAVDEAKKLFL